MGIWWKVAMLSRPENKSADIPICEVSGIFVWTNYWCFFLFSLHRKHHAAFEGNSSEKELFYAK